MQGCHALRGHSFSNRLLLDDIVVCILVGGQVLLIPTGLEKLSALVLHGGWESELTLGCSASKLVVRDLTRTACLSLVFLVEAIPVSLIL